MKYAVIASHTCYFSVKRMCQVLKVTRSGYYAWCRRTPSKREQSNQELVELIKKVFQASRRTYGSPRIYAYLRRRGWRCGHNRIARLMRMHGIVARRRRRRFPITTQHQPGVVPAPNLLKRNFTADRLSKVGYGHYLHRYS